MPLCWILLENSVLLYGTKGNYCVAQNNTLLCFNLHIVHIFIPSCIVSALYKVVIGIFPALEDSSLEID